MRLIPRQHMVATALTVYGIETFFFHSFTTLSFRLQQHLPFTVLKLANWKHLHVQAELQQHLPFTVLKRINNVLNKTNTDLVATALTVYGIETFRYSINEIDYIASCNSTYRLRY